MNPPGNPLLPVLPCVVAAIKTVAIPAAVVRCIVVAVNDAFWADVLCRICKNVFLGADLSVHRTAGAALESLAAQEADLVITGLIFPDADGLAVLDRFRQRSRLLLIISHRKDDWAIMTLRTARFDGFFDPQEDDPAVLEMVLPRIAAGDAYYSLSVKDKLLAPKLASVLSEKLTETELKVLRVIADGRTNAEAARVLGICERTVETHRQNIRHKLGVPSSAKLVLEAVRLGVAGHDLIERAGRQR